MSTSVMNSGPDGPGNSISGQIEIDFAKCECCGLIEECTPSYIEAIRERYGGKWICGLCAEAVKDEVLRSEEMVISPEEAMERHWSFCNKFRASGPAEDSTVDLIRAMRRLLRRSLESPRALNSPRIKRGDGGLETTDGCIPNLTLVEGDCCE